MKKYDKTGIVLLIFSGIITISALCLCALIIGNPNGNFLITPTLVALVGSITSIILNLRWKIGLGKSIIVYILTYAISVMLSFITFFSFNDVLRITTPIVMFIISTFLFMIIGKNSISRMVLLLSNPMLYYLIFVIFVFIGFSKQPCSWIFR